jgi:hypothetical protein
MKEKILNFWEDKNNQKTLLSLLGVISIAFLINVLFKLHMYGQRTTFAGESWLSTVSSIYIQNWVNEGFANLKFAMIRTFDSIEMRDFSDREVYASFLPGCLLVPYFIAKIFSIKPTLEYIEFIASCSHYFGALISALISFLLCKRLELSKEKTFWFSLFTGVAYIYSYTNFRILSFGYYTDTAIYIPYLLFILSEFEKNVGKRLLLKGLLIFIGFFHEWFFVSITLVSIFSEITRQDGKKRIGLILFSHLAPTLMALGIYGYHLHLVDKLEHSIHRMLRRSAFNPVSGTSFDHSYSDLWKTLFKHNQCTIILTGMISVWNYLESKVFKDNEIYKNLFIISFGSSVLQMLIALQHSAEHLFVGIKLLIPLGIFLPFFLNELSEFFSKGMRTKFLIGTLSTVLAINLVVDAITIATFLPEHKIYKKLQTVFSKYGYEDIFFSYNLEILLDKYPKVDIKTTEKDVKPSDRVEGEPYLHYSAKKQVYIIDEPKDILKMLDNRKLHNKAKVHIIFYPKLCETYKGKDFVQNLGDGMYMIDVPQNDIDSEDFNEKYACKHIMWRYGYFGSSWVKMDT